MPQRTVEIKVDIISDPNGTAKVKRIVTDLEKDVIASNRRTEASRKATDRAILASQQATASAAKSASKTQANALISDLKRMESEAKKTSGNIQSYLKSAFGGGLIGGAVGGFAGGIVASFASQVTQLPSLFKTQIDEMVRIASERQNAFKGLETMSKFLGLSPKDTQDTVRNLRLVKAGVVDIGEATIGLKNLLSSGFSLPEATKLLEAFSDTAAFGKSAALSFGEAIRGATEGIRNGNSILVDNVGLTKNLSQILKEAGFAEKDLMNVKDDMNVRQALYNGLLKEALPQMGDANRLTQGWTGNTAALTTAQTNLYAAIGDVIIRNHELNALIQTLTGDMNSLTRQVQDTESGWSRSINNMTSTFAGFVLDVSIGVRKEIADLNELINVIEVAAYGLLSLGTDLGTGWTSAGEERLKRFQEANARRGSYYRDAQNYETSERARYQSNLSSQRQQAAGGNFFSGNRSGFLTGIPNNVAFPGMLGTSGPGTYAGGSPIGGGTGRPRALPKTKSSKVNLKLKDEMSDALEIAAKYGLTVTSGKDGKHNAGSAHYTGGAFDIRAIGVFPGVLEAAMRELRGAGYAVLDERSRPPGQKEWSAAHVHVGGRKTPKNRTYDPQAVARVIDDWMPPGPGGRPMGTTDFLGTEVQGRDRQIDAGEKEIRQNEDILSLYRELDDALFNLNERTEEEILLRKIKLGQYPGLTEGAEKELLTNARLIDSTRAKIKADEKAFEESKRALEDYQQAQQRLFEDTTYFFEDKIQSFLDGGFKGLWKSILNDMKQNFVKQFAKLLAQAFGFGGSQSGGFNFGGLFGGGPGGTPNFNPASSGGMFGAIQRMFGFGSSSGAPTGSSSGGLSGTLSGTVSAGAASGSLMSMLGPAAASAGVMLGINALTSKTRKDDWMAGLFGVAFGWLRGLFGGKNAIKKLKEAALSTYGITVKDKSVLNALKQLGETMFGKGRVGENAVAVVSSDQGQNILRNYAEATGQSTKMIDRLYYGDENWSGNQFRSQFGGFRAMGGPVRAGMSYVVGERGRELFTPSQSGSISPTVGVGDQQMKVILGQLEETVHQLATKLQSFSAGQVVAMGSAENPEAIGSAVVDQVLTHPRLNDAIARGTGREF